MRREERARAAMKAGERLTTARELMANGDVGTAALLLKRAVLTRRASDTVRRQAKELLQQIEEEGAAEFEQVEQSFQYASSPTEIRAAMESLAQLELDYGTTPKLGRRIDSLGRRLTRSDKVKAFRREESAAVLMSEARALEAKGEICCAYLFYEKAAEHDDTQTGQDAAAKLARLDRDELLVEQVETCRLIRSCQTEFDKASRMMKHPRHRGKAFELLSSIIERSPADSEVHQAAVALLAG